jgi:hypothetical protein
VGSTDLLSRLGELRLIQGRIGELEKPWLEVVAQLPRQSTYRPALALIYCERHGTARRGRGRLRLK